MFDIAEEFRQYPELPDIAESNIHLIVLFDFNAQRI